MMQKKQGFIIAATKSGAGKTTLTLGIMAALVKRGLRVQPFKCGPDFIDPTLHRVVTGNISYNIDLKMMGRACCRETFCRYGDRGDILVLEGVMGLFDGGDSSTAAVAKALGLPVFLIIDAQSSAESAAAVLKGFELYDPDVKIAGVIFNKIGSPRHRQLIDSAVIGRSTVPVIGYMTREEHFSIPERHLGLYMGSENPLDQEALDALAVSSEKLLDIDKMLSCAAPVDHGSVAPAPASPSGRKRKRIGISMDEAFCFYYPQNIELFSHHGFDIIPFSPLHDRQLPVDLDMIYLCGGYPENFAEKLAGNHSMIQSLQKAHELNISLYAECGGFMYLCKSITDKDQGYHEMVGIFPYHSLMNKRLRRLGYREVRLRETCMLGGKGDLLYGHEFHYSDIQHPKEGDGHQQQIKKLYHLDNNSYEGYSSGTAIGSYVHLHFANTPTVFHRIIQHIESRQA